MTDDRELLQSHGLHLLSLHEERCGVEVVEATIVHQQGLGGSGRLYVVRIITEGPSGRDRRWRLLLARIDDRGRRYVIRLAHPSDGRALIHAVEEALDCEEARE